MAVKKSELYSSLWASCDELRGGMDASQYKDYVLVMLFIKYVSDKYAGQKYAPIQIPKGASFQDMVALKGKPTIGDDINKKIIAKLTEANKSLGTIDVDFNNAEKLGTGKEMVTRLTNLIAIFENPALDFSKNKADGDDLLGDAYEYLMRHFATESGKSKGQFYTPAEVSRIIAKVIGVDQKKVSADTTVYDPTCGSGSLLLKVADEAEKKLTIYGQEKDISTAALARMNMVLHDCPTASIQCNGNSTLSDPLFKSDKGGLKTFDFVVANPPFSYKAWMSGVDPVGDEHKRFEGFGVPPAKNGDYAFLLHIVRSLKTSGKAACILPHGVLFRGNTEADIRKNLIKKGYIKGIIGLPANLFYGTGIPACIVLIDKEKSDSRKEVFIIDASKGFIKDGNKNRLRSQDIHKIVDVFTKGLEIPKFSRNVPIAEIEKNEYNLNIPRYIDSQEAEDLQNIDAHLRGGIPAADISALDEYWQVYPNLKEALFKKGNREGFFEVKVAKEAVKQTIFSHPDFTAYNDVTLKTFDKWAKATRKRLLELDKEFLPKTIIHEISEEMLKLYRDVALIDEYAIYQHLMDYWAEIMQDDLYEIAADGYAAGKEFRRTMKEGKTGNKAVAGIDGIEGTLIPVRLLIEVCFKAEKETVEKLESEREAKSAAMEEMREEQGGEEGLLAEVVEDGKLSKKNLVDRIKELGKKDNDNAAEWDTLHAYKHLMEEESRLGGEIKQAEKELETKVEKKYPKLTIEEIKQIVVDEKWLKTIGKAIQGECDRISQTLASRIKELAERYEATLPELSKEVGDLEAKVSGHLQKMGFSL